MKKTLFFKNPIAVWCHRGIFPKYRNHFWCYFHEAGGAGTLQRDHCASSTFLMWEWLLSSPLLFLQITFCTVHEKKKKILHTHTPQLHSCEGGRGPMRLMRHRGSREGSIVRGDLTGGSAEPSHHSRSASTMAAGVH